MTISLKLNAADTKVFKSYAKTNGISLSELIRCSVTNYIEDEYDLKAYEEAMLEFKKDPKTYTHEEVW